MKSEEKRSPDITQLSHELTYRRYLMNKGQTKRFFQELSIPEYIVLHIVEKNEKESEIYSGRTYLKELAEKLQLTIRQTSRMVNDMKGRGLLLWSHDGDGSEGTYVRMTDEGRAILETQEETLKKYYGKVIDKFGKENLIQLLQMMKQLETVMDAELEEMEGEIEDEQQDE